MAVCQWHDHPYFCLSFCVLSVIFLIPTDMIFIGLSADGQLRTVSIGISPSPGTPPTAQKLRKYHCHRCLSSHTTGSNPVIKSSDSSACWFITFATTGMYLLKEYVVVNDRTRGLFIPSYIYGKISPFSQGIFQKFFQLFSDLLFFPIYTLLGETDFNSIFDFRHIIQD